MMHLWEADHSYYCAESNFYARGDDQPFARHRRWQDFLAEEGEADLDYNLLFRWDWSEKDGDDEPTYTGDDNYRNGRLLLFFMGQHKGLYRWAEVEVCRADEPAVIKYLKPRLAHLMSLWAPLTDTAGSADRIGDRP